MEAIILAGGRGTRLQAVVQGIPKPMAPVAGRPFLELLLANLARNGFRRAILSVGYLAEQIIDHFGNEYRGIELEYVVEEKPLGTGGAIALALQRCRSDHAFVLNGDTFIDLDFGALEMAWRRSGLPIIVLRNLEDVDRFGSVELEGGYIRAFCEKGRTGPGRINAGVYVLPADLPGLSTAGGPFSFETEFLAEAVKRSQFLSYECDGVFIDIGVPEDYARSPKVLAPWTL